MWLSHIGHLPQLECLTIDGKRITDAGVRNLSSLKNLRYLDLYATGLSDLGLDYLVTLDHLEELHIGGTLVTESGVKKLTKLMCLRKLFLPDGMSDSKAAQALRNALPECKVN
jgi:Leucine-rich repeat (LRR) protein